MILRVVKQRKKRYKNDIDRIQAVRTSKAKYQKKYRLRKKEKKEEEKQQFTDKTYQSAIYNNIKDLLFCHECTLRFNQYVSIEYATAAVQYFTKRLGKGYNNLIYTFEYGKDNNIHIHLAFNFSKEFLKLYTDYNQIEKYLHSIWNNDKVKNGSVWCRPFKTNEHKQNYLNYILKQILPLSKYHYRQKQVDLYYIQSFKNEPNIYSKESTMFNQLNDALIKANIKPLNSLNAKVNEVLPKQKIKPYISLKSVIKKYKQKLIPVAMAAVWILMI